MSLTWLELPFDGGGGKGGGGDSHCVIQMSLCPD